MLSRITLITLFLLLALYGQAQLMDSIVFTTYNVQVSNLPSGVAYDPGGPFNSYGTNESSGLLLNVSCATSITVSVQEYSVETCCDNLQFFDGPDINATYLGSASFQSLPFTVSSTSGTLFIRWYSDGSVAYNGFRLTWASTVVPADPPVANILVDDDNLALSQNAHFMADSGPSIIQWSWNFGDGTTANTATATHTWTQSGNYPVSLIVTNCEGLSDTTTRNITVQTAPTTVVSPTSLQLDAGCGDTARATVTLTNTGAGDLIFTGSASFEGKKKVLLYSYYANQASLTGISNLLSLYPNDYEVTVAYFTDQVNAQLLLDHHDIVVFPTLDFTDPWVLMPYASQMQQFVAEGGSIVHCGQYNYNTAMSAFGFFPNTNVSSYEFTNPTIPVTSGHPITAGLPSNMVFPPYAGGIAVGEPNYVSLADYQNYSFLGYLNLPKGNVVYLGSGFQNFNLNLVNLLRHTLDWCGKKEEFEINPLTGIIHPGESQDVQLVIPTFGLTPGNYAGTLTINTNNPAQASVNVPFELHLTGQAQLLVTPSVANFDSIMQFTTDTIGLTLMNIGCDTLFITDISSTNPAFVIGVDSFVIAPYANTSLGVLFQPQDTGAYNGQIVFQTNTGMLQTTATGYAFGAPVLSLNPDSIGVTIDCGDSTSVEVVVSNTGLGTLSGNLSGTNVGIGDTIDVIVLNFLAYNWGGTTVSYNMQNWIAYRYPDVPTRVFNFSGSTVDELKNTLQTMDVALIPFAVNNGYMNPIEVGQALKTFMNNGGSLILSGTTFSEFFTQLGLSSSSGNYVSNWLAGQIVDPSHPLLQNISFATTPYDNMISQQFNDPEMIDVMTITPDIFRSAISYKPFGNGKMIYLGYEYYYEYPDVVQLLGNSLRWNSKNASVTASVDSFNLQPGESQTITLKIKGQELNAGIYTTNIYLNSNDPAHPQITLPVTINIAGLAQLGTTSNTTNFGLIQQFAPQTRSIPLENMGCDTLFITGVNASSNDLSLTSNPAYVLPGHTLDLNLHLTATLPGGFSGTVIVNTNAGDFTITVNAVVIGAPVAAVNPAAMTQQLGCQETTQQPFSLQNSGLSSLTYRTGYASSTKKALLMTFGAEQPRTGTMKSYLSNELPDLNITEMSQADAQVLSDSLTNADLLIIPPLSNIDPAQIDVFDEFGTVIQQFLNKGKSIIITGVSNTDPVLRMGLFSSGFSTDIAYNPVITRKIGSHPLTEGLNKQFLAGPEYIGGLNFIPADGFIKIWESANGSTYLGYRIMGNGTVTYLGASFNSITQEVNTLLSNACQWSFNPVPPGVILDELTGAVAIGNTTNINVDFSSDDLPGGQYPGFIRLRTNDPLHPALQLPVTVNVSQAPCADFSFTTNACGGTVEFADESLNGVFSWYWQFGDGFDAFSISPTHNYAAAGTYEVTLIACNGNGCDTIVQTIQVNGTLGPIAAACTPQVSNSICCETGIYNVTFNSLENFSSGASEGYKDNSCSIGTEVVAGSAYSLLVQTGNSIQEYVRVWIDYNNNGSFSTNELVLTDINYLTHNTTVQIPATAVKNTSLRMRVISEAYNYSPPGACSTPNNGQIEDYYIVIKNNSSASDLTETQYFKMYPNPSFGDVWLDIQEDIDGDVSINIFDETGRLVHESKIEDQNTKAVQLPNLPVGTYLVRIQTSEWTRTEKLIRMD
ncbi:MAG: PKD domain-containing protein [Saprospiraceae bacterium]|nr:PKD domain-containing protein [Saprospiraceae bacterium]